MQELCREADLHPEHKLDLPTWAGAGADGYNLFKFISCQEEGSEAGIVIKKCQEITTKVCNIIDLQFCKFYIMMLGSKGPLKTYKFAL